MSRLRVMRIIARMNVGGPAVQVSGLMRNLPADEFDQRLYTGWCADDEADYLKTQASDVEAIRVEGLGRAIRPGDDARALGTLVREIKRWRPHIVHTHTAKAGVLGRAAVRLAATGSATVHTFHGHLLRGYFSPGKTRAVIELEKALARGTDRLVAVGPQVRDDLLAVGIGRPEKYAVIPPGLVMREPLPSADMRAALGIAVDAPVIAFIGRITGIKRPDRLVEIVERVVVQHPDVVVLVAGAGDQIDLLEQAASRLPLRLLGWRDDVQDIFGASDLTVLTSDNEGTPLSLIQAALLGVPAVASDVGSVHDVVVDGETGWLAPPRSADLAETLLAALNNPAEIARRGSAAALRAQALYGVERLAADHADLYRSIRDARAR